MTQRSFFILLFAFALTSFSGCEISEPEPVAPIGNPPTAAMGAPCILGTVYNFPLDVEFNPYGNLDPDYAIRIETGTYNHDGCLCEVQSYSLSFQTIKNIEEVELTDAGGNPVPFMHVQNPDPTPGTTGDVLVLTDIGALPGPVATVYLNFTGEVQALMDAGGLCVIENFGGNYGTDPQSQPLYDQVPNTPPATGMRTRVFIPTDIGQPI